MADEEMRLGKAVSKEARAEKMPENGHLGVEVEDEGEEGQPDKPEDFQQDAKIWSLYLKEASDLAKAQTELWKTGLDSLLLFAGLFASVVSAFVIESRKELRMDDQEQLIRNIYNIQLGEKPQEDNYKPSMDDLWINGLWFTSLLITLLSAIVGVLAKSWLVKYVPLAAREDFEEAHRRWTLERSVTQWHMEWVFTMLPLFVQLAFFLFAAGFTIQCFKDHQTLGCVVSAIVGVGVLAYLLATALPLLPDGLCPFRTPLSEILIQLRKLMSKKPNTTTPASDIDQESLHQVLGKIWEKELKSPKQDDVDEAVAQIARRPLTDERLESFADSYTPNIVLKRLERCMTSDYQEDPRRNEIISNHLLALSRFISHSEKTKHKHGGLKSTLKNSLGSKEPLGRWNFFTEPTLPLAFSIRVPLLLAFNQDIATTEVLEQPWEQLARALKPKHRLRFFLASCRALVTGRENLRKVSSLSIASCMALATKAGFKSEWGSESKDKSNAKDLVRRCIIRVCNEIARSWESEALEYWKTYSSTGTIEALEHGAQSSGFPRSLDTALKHSKIIYRQQAVSIILLMADFVDPQSEIAQAFPPSLIQTAASDDSGEVRTAAINALKSMAKKEAYRTMILQELKELTDGNLELFHWQRVAELSTALADDASVFTEVPEAILTNLVRAACMESGVFGQKSARALLEQLAQKSTIQRVLEATIRARITEDLGKGWRSRQAVFKDIDDLRSCCTVAQSTSPTGMVSENETNGYPAAQSALFTEDLFKKATVGLAGRLVTCAMTDDDEDVRRAGQAILRPLLDMKSPVDGQADALSQLKKDMDDALFSDDWSIRRDAIVFLSEHVDSTFADLIENTIPSLPHILLTDDDYDVQDAAIVALEKFAVHPNYAPASLKALFVDLGRYMEFDSSNQKRFISLIAQLIREGGGGEDQVGQGLQYLLSLTIHHDDKDVRDVGREALASLCSANLPVLGSVKAALHPRVNQGEAGSNESVRWKEVIIYLMQKDSVRSTCCAALQLAFGDNPSENPSETIEVRHVSQNKLGQPQHILDQSGVDSPRTLLASIVCMEDVQQSIRLAALRTLQFMLLEQDTVPRWDDFRGLDDGLHEDSNPEVRVYYLNLLVTAAKKDESSKVFKRAIARCAQAIRPLLSSNKSVAWGMESAAILGTLAKNGYLAEGIPRLVAMAVKDEDKNVRKASLQSLAEFVAQPNKNPSSVQAIMAGLGKKLNTIDFRRISQPERLAWVGVLSALSIHAADSDIDRQKLIDLAITDGDATVRAEAYKGLHELIQDSKLRDGSNRALVNGFKSALRSSHWYKRYQIVESLRFDVSSMAPLLIFNTILQPLVAPLMKVALNDQSEFVRDAVQSLLTFLITHASAEGPLQLYDTDIRSTILSAITDHIVLFSDRDKLVALSLIEAMPENITDDVVSPFARGVIRLLKNPHVPTRATALEILTILYRKGVITSIIHSHLSDIVTLALEDDHNGTRVIALKLLTCLCSDDKLRRKIRTAQPTLMSFLENHDLRSTTVELISVLAQDQSVRQLVANWVVSVIASDSEAQIEGMMALLLRLVVEKRPDANPKRSEILFFIAPAFVLRRSMAKSRARLTALLWTNYQDFVHEGLEYCQELPQSLIDCFVTAVFGHHVAQHELKEWLKLGEYLKPTESGEARQTSAK